MSLVNNWLMLLVIKNNTRKLSLFSTNTAQYYGQGQAQKQDFLIFFFKQNKIRKFSRLSFLVHSTNYLAIH